MCVCLSVCLYCWACFEVCVRKRERDIRINAATTNKLLKLKRVLTLIGFFFYAVTVLKKRCVCVCVCKCVLVCEVEYACLRVIA